MPDQVRIEVFRYDPEKPSAGGYFQSYEVPYVEDWTVLDALNHIKDHLDGSVTYRWSCRMGVCGSCGMMVNGQPTLTCGSFLSEFYPGTIRVEPLEHFPVVRDLVVDVQPFIDKLTSVKPWIIRAQDKPVEQGEYLQSPEQLAEFKQFTLCINCMLCYAACPVSGIEPDFVGPAALALAHRYNMDSRDEGFKQRRDAVFSHSAVWACTYIGECSVVCPKHVDPAAAIQQEKLLAAQDWVASLLPGRG